MERNKNLIAISGRIGSGKDTIGKIIQYLTSESKLTEQDSCYSLIHLNEDITGYHNSKFEIKKFADKLKDIVCLLIGCTREDLENQEFKEKELGEEWWYLKSEDATISVQYKGVNSFEGKTKEYTERFTLVKLTPRLLLQLLGTECGRDIIHPNIWVNSLFSKFKPTEYFGVFEEVEPKWIITDCRFKNELEAVKQRGGITIRVERELQQFDRFCFDCNKGFNFEDVGISKDVKCPNCSSFNHSSVQTDKSAHPSETDLDNQKFDYLINNDASISDLIDKVREILISENILV